MHYRAKSVEILSAPVECTSSDVCKLPSIASTSYDPSFEPQSSSEFQVHTNGRS